MGTFMRLTLASQKLFLCLLAGCLALLICAFIPGALALQAAAPADYWPMYLSGPDHSGFNRTETAINKTSVQNLKQHWSFQTGAAISSQPVEAHGLVYWGSWDGNEYAADLNGNKVWSTRLGQTSNSRCQPTSAGVASTATVVNISIGTATSVVFVGGGDANLYALNAANGTILWHTLMGTPSSTFIWSSPVYYKGSIYVDVSSYGDCPMVQGKLVKLDAITGQITNTFFTVPNGCTGGGVWASPTIDAKNGAVYIVTGNAGKCSTSEPYTSAMIKLLASNLSLISYWQVPANEQIFDGDFGATSILFNASIKGSLQNMVGAVDKNGVFYAFSRNSISNGPLWAEKVSVGGSCPLCGTADISPAAWDGTMLYVAGGSTSIGNQSCLGSIRALDPATGSPIWQQCLQDGPVLAPVSAVPGLVVVTAGTDVSVFDSSNGDKLTVLTDTSRGSLYYGASSISQGVLYVGNMDGILHAYGL